MKELYALADLTISASTKPETFGRANVGEPCDGRASFGNPDWRNTMIMSKREKQAFLHTQSAA